jgi:hypothetical protein
MKRYQVECIGRRSLTLKVEAENEPAARRKAKAQAMQAMGKPIEVLSCVELGPILGN